MTNDPTALFPAKPSTAKRGDPLAASRGDRVRKEKVALADALDAKLGLTDEPDPTEDFGLQEQQRLDLLGELLGRKVTADDVGVMTLGEIRQAREKAKS